MGGREEGKLFHGGQKVIADELRRIVVERPPAPVTADPGLATVPPEQLTLTTQPEAAADTTPKDPEPPAVEHKTEAEETPEGNG